MIWEPRGTDRNNEYTWVGVTMGRTFLITKSTSKGVRLWRMDGLTRRLEGVGYTSVNAAKMQAEVMA